MPPAGFKPTIPASKRAQTLGFERAALHNIVSISNTERYDGMGK